MPAWIECRECGVEFKEKPGRTKCPDCGARFESRDRDEPEEWDDEPRKKSGKKKGGNGVLFAGIGVGVLAVGLVVVLILLLTGKKGDASKVTVANFQKLTNSMTRADAEAILGGSSSSSVSDMQDEMSRAYGPLAGLQQGMFTQMLTGGGTWRRWDGKGLMVWGMFNTNAGGGTEKLAYSMALEKTADGYVQHNGNVTIGFPFGAGGNPFPGGNPFGGAQMPPVQFPPFPK